MKIVGILFLLLLCQGITAQEIVFGEKEYDFGVIQESAGTVYHDFYFMNTGDKPLRIRSVLVGCGCTSSEWPRNEVQPGEKACIRVSYHPQYRDEKKFTKVAEIYTNSVNFGTHKGVHNLYISGEVKRGERIPVRAYHLEVLNRRAKGVVRTKGVYTDILGRMQAELIGQIPDVKADSLTTAYVASLQRGGKWADIDYACYFRTNWEVVKHLERIQVLACSYVSDKGKFCGNDTLFQAIQDALSFWVKTAPKSHNWWFNQIAVPQHLGNILVLLDRGEKVLPDELKNRLFKIMAWPDPREWTGANKLDIALHHLQRGCLLQNDSIVRIAAQQIFYPVRVTTSEGIQPDLSYQQHGNQLYVGGYGTVFAEGVTRVAAWLRNTPYALQGEQLRLFSDFIRKTYLNVFRGGYIDFSVTGRGISRENILDGRGCVDMLKRLQSLDTEHAEEYAEAIVRFSQPGQSDYGRKQVNTVYWRSDYALHNREKFDFSVRTASVRTRKTESGNGENLCGGFLSDGATCIRRNGDEYYNIFPVWDWNKIPGVTAPNTFAGIATDWGEMGKSVFSGGVSDGRLGIMAFRLNDRGVKASKSWFFFDREVVCLGAGINSGAGVQVTTCLNQCLLKGDVLSDAGKQKVESKADGNGQKGKLNWVLHDRILYYFPQPVEAWMYAGKQSGNWNRINYNYSAERLEKDVFKLWLDHGSGVVDGTYAYFVVPDVSDPKDYQGGGIEIVKNEAEQQAVYNRAEDLLQAVFYQAGEINYKGITLTVGHACAIMVKGWTTEKPEIILADPAQKVKTINWQIRSNGRSLNGKAKVTLPEYRLMK